MKIQNQVSNFLLIGAISTAIDFIIYFALTYLGIPRDVSKFFAFVSGTGFGYFGNSKLTFNDKEPNFPKYILVYGSSMFVNILTNASVVSVLENRAIGWFSATFASSTVNFIGLRYYAFVENV